MGRAIRVLDLISVDGAGGGAEKIVLRTAARTDRDRFVSTMCCLRCADDAAYDMDVRARELGIDYCEVVTRSKFDRNVFPALRQIVRDRKIAIVHAHGYKPAFFAWRLARSEGVTPLSTSHGWTGHHWRERYLYYPADKLFIRTFPLAIAVSSQIREVLIRWGCYPDKVRVLLNGIDPQEYRRDPSIRARVRSSFGLGDGDIVLGAAGRLEPQKRFDILINAFERLRTNHRPLKLFIAGEGSLRVKLQAQIEKLGMSGLCTLLGHRGDIRELYQAFDVLVQSSDYEGTPTVVVEAMALEVPVVATDAGGTRELITDGEHGLVVPLRNLSSLVDAINFVLDDAEATARRVFAGRRRVEGKLSFDARTSKLEEIYQELASAESRHRTKAGRERVVI